MLETNTVNPSERVLAFDRHLRMAVAVPLARLRELCNMNPPASRLEIAMHGASPNAKHLIERERMDACQVPDIEDAVSAFNYAALAAMGAGVYFIRETDGPVKIGFASNIAMRFFTLQTGNPRQLQFLAAINGNRDTERAWHERFKHAHIAREWFNPVAELMDEIEAIQ